MENTSIQKNHRFHEKHKSEIFFDNPKVVIISEKNLQVETIGSSYLTNPTNVGVPHQHYKNHDFPELRVSYE